MERYVETNDRQPPKPGYYTVMRKVHEGHAIEDRYYWNGGYWVTNGGSPSYAVLRWLEITPDPDKET